MTTSHHKMLEHLAFVGLLWTAFFWHPCAVFVNSQTSPSPPSFLFTPYLSHMLWDNTVWRCWLELLLQVDPTSAGVPYDKEFIVCSLDLLSGLAEGLRSGIESLVFLFLQIFSIGIGRLWNYSVSYLFVLVCMKLFVFLPFCFSLFLILKSFLPMEEVFLHYFFW